MFSENNRISAHQMKWILTMEWTAKLCLLYPEYLAGKSAGSMVLCIVAGLLVSLLVLRLLWRWRGGCSDVFEAIGRSLCRPAAVVIYTAGILYFFADAAVFLNLAAELVQEYLLMEVAIPFLVLPFAVAALYLCLSGIEVRGRFSEVVGPLVQGLLWLLLFLTAFGMRAYQTGETVIRMQDHLTSGIYEVFAGVDLFLSPFLVGSMLKREEEGKAERAVQRALVQSMGTAGVLCAVTAMSYGSNTMSHISFPAIRVMGNVPVPGGFLQRFEVWLLVLVLFGLTVTVGGALWYMRGMSLRLYQEAECEWNACANHASRAKHPVDNRQNLPWSILAAAVVFAAAGFLNEVSSFGYYRGFCMHLLIPLFFFVFVAAWLQKKSRGISFAALLLLCCLLLTGCTARELEERLFPMALEFSVGDGQLVMICAWNEGSGPGSKMEPGENRDENRQDGEETSGFQAGKSSGESPQDGSGHATQTRFANVEVRVEENQTVFCGPSLKAVQEALLDYTEQYVDYSHVKAVILDERLTGYPELEKEVIEWMKDCPEFATSLILYPKEKTGLSLAMVEQRAAGKVGSYLENLYRNNERYRSASWTLGGLLSEYYKED